MWCLEKNTLVFGYIKTAGWPCSPRTFNENDLVFFEHHNSYKHDLFQKGIFPSKGKQMLLHLKNTKHQRIRKSMELNKDHIEIPFRDSNKNSIVEKGNKIIMLTHWGSSSSHPPCVERKFMQWRAFRSSSPKSRNAYTF